MKIAFAIVAASLFTEVSGRSRPDSTKPVKAAQSKASENLKATPVDDEDDFDKAEHAIFDAVESVEKKIIHEVEHVAHEVEHIIHDEVDTLFHDREHHEPPEEKPETKKQTKATKKDKEKSKSKADEPAFVRGKINDEDDFDKAEHAIFDAVEHAEKAAFHAVEHAVHDEVDILFHDLKHKEKDETTKVDMTTHAKSKTPSFVRGKTNTNPDPDESRTKLSRAVEDYLKCMNYE